MVTMTMMGNSRKFQRVAHVDELIDGGKGVTFDIEDNQFERGFVIRFKGKLYAYRNQCPHLGSQLDWTEGDFFDEDSEFITCATHGAIFDPVTGNCINGPCVNERLTSLAVECNEGTVYVCVDS